MSDSLKAGSVYVAVTASIGEFTKSMQQVVKQVQETAKKVKEAATYVAGVGALFAVGIVKAVQEAAKANKAMGHDTERLQRILTELVREFGELFAPLVRKVVDALSRILGAFQRLDPGIKKVMSNVALFGAGTGVFAAGVAGAAGLVEGFAKTLGVTVVPALKGLHSALPSIGKAFKETGVAIAEIGKMDVFASLSSGVNSFKNGLTDLPSQMAKFGKNLVSIVPQLIATTGPILLFAAAVGALALLAGSVYDAWTHSSTGFKDSVLELVDWVLNLSDKTQAVLLSVFDSATNFAMALASVMFEALADKVRAVAAFCEAVARTLGRTTLADNLAQVQKVSADGFLAYVNEKLEDSRGAAKALLAYQFEVYKSQVDDVKYGFTHAVSGVKSMIKDSGLVDLGQDIAEFIKAKVGKLTDLFDHPVDVPTLERDPKAAGGYGFSDFEKIREMGRKGRTLYQEAFNEHAKIIREAVKAAAQSLKDKAVGRTGNVQGLVESGAQGAAVAGPMGAVAAVTLDLLTQSKAFQGIVTMVNNTIQLVAESLGVLLAPLQPLIGSVLRVGTLVATALTPVLSFVGQLLEPLAPVFVVIGDLLQVLQPILLMFTGALQLVTLPMRLLVEVELRALFEGVKKLGAGLLWVVEALSGAWNGIVSGLQWLLRGLTKLPLVGDAFESMAKMLDGVKLDQEALRQSQYELNHLTWDQATAKAAETAATLKNTEALNQATESLTNVPAAWKVAQARFNAQDARDASPLLLPPSGAAPLVSAPAASRTASSAPALTAQAAAPALQIDTINVSASSPAEALDALEKHLNNLSFRRRGTSAGLSRYAIGDV